jgi:hypothetical protein
MSLTSLLLMVYLQQDTCHRPFSLAAHSSKFLATAQIAVATSTLIITSTIFRALSFRSHYFLQEPLLSLYGLLGAEESP